MGSDGERAAIHQRRGVERRWPDRADRRGGSGRRESAPGRLYDHPVGASFVGRAESSLSAAVVERAPPLNLRGSGYSANRTRYFDDCLLDAVQAGCRDMVPLGGGLDTRAYRVDWPAELRLFEVDLVDVLAFEQAVREAEFAAPTCRRDVAPVDLLGG